ncbi:hypothetical protein HZM15_001719 [Salmonella enterica]|nr:hypothetical protein [Salmonella enterica]EJF4850820.1 hypothetical protein [Salmonella enterica]
MFPAPAGINRWYDVVDNSTTGVPRASGDKPRRLRPVSVRAVCSPRQRG